MTENTKTCKELVYGQRVERMRQVRSLWKLYQKDPEAYNDDGKWDEYGLSFEYIPAGTFHNTRGYWRYQLSWGGPSDEFRFFADERLNLVKVEYRYMDWFDGASSRIGGRDFKLWEEIWQDWSDCELQKYKMDEALKQ